MDGRGVVVLGVGGGIGGHTVVALAEAGARVLCVDVDAERARQAAKECGGEHVAADVTSREALGAVFARAEVHFGADFAGIVDVVGAPVPTTLADASEEIVSRQLDLVLRHVVLVTQLGIPRLAARGRGAVVIVGSLAGIVDTPRLGLYGMAKAAVHRLALSAAHEFGPAGVRVNVVAPGRIAQSGSVSPSADSIARITAAVPLGRLGTPSDVAGAVLFLMSDLAAYVTGAVVPVDGGIRGVSALPS
ncbi:MAG: SDR family NAD(P)-dependent oxidoreductase [Frankia sp.]